MLFRSWLSFRKGERVTIPPPDTIADGLRSPCPGKLTFPIIQSLVEDVILVTEDEIRAVVAACAQGGVPITVRGSGTGNYGQCMPLHGGVILDLSAYNKLLWHKPGIARAQAGIRMMELDRQTQAVEGSGQGWELRCVPSTFRSATLGGLYGGGFGGVGSINYGPLASTGNVFGVRAMTIEPEPRAVELRAPEALLLHHVYGTNGLVLELEVGLAPAHPWLEAIACFDSFDAAIEFGQALAVSPGIVKKSVTLLADPIPDILMRGVPQLAGQMKAGAHAILMVVAEFSEPGMLQVIAQFGGAITYRKTADEVRRSNRTIVEYTWNHTTLHALKVDGEEVGVDPAELAFRQIELAARQPGARVVGTADIEHVVAAGRRLRQADDEIGNRQIGRAHV